MQKVLTAEQMRNVDRLTTERYGIPSIILMENAAHAVARVITEKLGNDLSVTVLCGKGNNGGDGAALARILWSLGADVNVYLFGFVEETKSDARVNFEAIKKINERDPPFSPYLFLYENEELDFQKQEIILRSHVIIDAVFGTGLTRPIESTLAELFKHIKIRQKFLHRRPFLISIDLPSGLNADSESDYSDAFEADCTVTFTAPKPANVLAPNHRKNGELIIAPIGSPYELIDESPSDLEIWDHYDVSDWLNRLKFSDDSYKNKRGHALVIAGSESYSGAAVLAGNAAMRSGVGLVTLAVPAAILSEVAARALPDLIVRAFDDGGEIDFAADAVLIGCGLDTNDSANEAMFRKIVEERTTPVIVDAGALGYLNPERRENHPVGETPPPLLGKKGRQSELILTPHEGEFRRLLGETNNHPVGETPTPLLRKEGSLKEDRVAAVREFAVTNNVILVLKGERVLVGSPDGRVVVNPTGNSGLGKAGNGDTLAGILAGFVAQAVKFEIDIFDTVVAAVYVAGMAGDVAEKKYGKRVMTASDVRECLTEVFAELER